jgi:hypothetical protein
MSKILRYCQKYLKNPLFSPHFQEKWFLKHIFKKLGSTEIVVSSVRPSIRPSVSYFSAAIAPRELKFST